MAESGGAQRRRCSHYSRNRRRPTRTHTFRGRSRRVSQHAHNVVAVVVFDIKRARARAHFQLTARRSQRTNADSANQCGVCVAARQQSLCDQDARIIMSTTRFVLHGGGECVCCVVFRSAIKTAGSAV